MSSKKSTNLNLPIIQLSPSNNTKSRNLSIFNKKSMFCSATKTYEKNRSELSNHLHQSEISPSTSRFIIPSSRNPLSTRDTHAQSNSKQKDNSTKTLFRLKIKKTIIDKCDDIVSKATNNLKSIKDHKINENILDNKPHRVTIVEVLEKIGPPERFIEKLDNYYNSPEKDIFIHNYFENKKKKNKISFDAIKEKLNLKAFATLNMHQKLFNGVSDNETKNIDSYSIEHFLNKVVKLKKNIVKKINNI